MTVACADCGLGGRRRAEQVPNRAEVVGTFGRPIAGGIGDHVTRLSTGAVVVLCDLQVEWSSPHVLGPAWVSVWLGLDAQRLISYAAEGDSISRLCHDPPMTVSSPGRDRVWPRPSSESP